MKNRSIKTKKPSNKHKMIAYINLKIKGNKVLPVFTETTPEIEKNKKIVAMLNNSDIFLNHIYSKS